jgi:hypothetical protein
VYEVLAVRPVSLKEVVVAAAIFAPLRQTSYPVTPTSSVDAVQARSICVALLTVAVKPVGAVGAVVSVTFCVTVPVGVEIVVLVGVEFVAPLPPQLTIKPANNIYMGQDVSICFIHISLRSMVFRKK